MSVSVLGLGLAVCNRKFTPTMIQTRQKFIFSRESLSGHGSFARLLGVHF